MRELYELIANQIATQVPGIKWVALWPGQHALQPGGLPFGLPAVFVEIEATWRNMTNTLQNADANITLRLVTHSPGPQSPGANGQQATLQRIDLLQALYLALQGVRSDRVTAMWRTGQHLGHTAHTLATDVLTLSTHLADDGRPNRYQKIKPNLTLTKSNP